MIDIKGVLLQWLTNFLIKNLQLKIRLFQTKNQLKNNTNQLHSSFIDNIWGANLADMQLIRKFNQEICFYYVLLIFSAYTHGR